MPAHVKQQARIESPAASPSPPPGCQFDTQCKGNRVCQSGRCVDPGQGPSVQPQPTQTGAAESVPSAQAAPADPPTLKQQCDAGKAAGCVGLAMLYEEGNGVTRDRNQAAELYEKGCRLGSSEGCKGMMRTAK